MNPKFIFVDFETVSHNVLMTGMEFTMQTRQAGLKLTDRNVSASSFWMLGLNVYTSVPALHS